MSAIVPYEVAGDFDHDDPRWLEMRRSGIGASEMAAILGESSWGSPLSIWLEKTKRAPAKDLNGNERVFWGKKLEPAIIEAFSERTRRKVTKERRTFRSRDHRWALASLDAWTEDESGDVPIPLEVKAIGFERADDWADGAPLVYRVQLHQQMIVAGAMVGIIAALIGGQRLVWERVERDDVLVRRILHAGAKFWEHVEKDEPPAADAAEATKHALGALYPTSDGSTIVLGSTESDLFWELERVKDEIKGLATKQTALENQIKARLGNAERGICPDGCEFSWKVQERKEYVVAAGSSRVLRCKAPKRKVA